MKVVNRSYRRRQMAMFSLALSPQLHAAIFDQAARRNQPMSDFIRQAVEAHIARCGVEDRAGETV
jgi:hypothetical protein